ncbi:hypothetical protein AQEC111735_12155 [Aquirufa ecclesiirivi]
MAAPALMVTLELVTAVPDAGVKVKVPEPIVPENINTPVKFDTPLTKLPMEFITFPPEKPVTAPVNEEVTVTLFVAALKLVTALP